MILRKHFAGFGLRLSRWFERQELAVSAVRNRSDLSPGLALCRHFVCVHCSPMTKEERYVSPDSQLIFLVIWEEADVTLGFEGSAWHTHGDMLANSLGTTVEQAVRRFVDDLLSDKSVIAICSFDWSPRYVSVEDGSGDAGEDAEVERRYWSGRRPGPL